MKRRNALRKAGIGLIGFAGLAGATAGTASADCSGSCWYQKCTCSGNWYECGDGMCCDGTVDCDCQPTCQPGCPC